MAETTHIERSYRLIKGHRYHYVRMNGTEVNADYISVGNYPEYRDGVKNPKWKDQVRKKQNATTALSGIRVHSDQPNFPSYIKVLYNQPKYYASRKIMHEAWIYPPPAFLTDSALRDLTSSEAENEAQGKFHKKVNEAFVDLQGGVILGELVETVALVKKRGKSVIKLTDTLYRDMKKLITQGSVRESEFLRALKRLKNASKKDLAKLHRDLADLWLEYSFGIRPLVNDVEDAMSYAIHSSKASRAVRAVSSRTVSSTRSSVFYGGSGAQISWIKVREDHVQHLYYGSVSIEGLVGEEWKHLGLHPRNFAPTIYELIPWSFLIDYFTNLNEVIAGLSNIGLKLDWVCHTQRNSSECRFIAPRAKPYPQGTYPDATIVIDKFEPRPVRFWKTSVERTPLSDVPIPGLVISLPEHVTQYVNIYALLKASEETRNVISKL